MNSLAALPRAPLLERTRFRKPPGAAVLGPPPESFASPGPAPTQAPPAVLTRAAAALPRLQPPAAGAGLVPLVLGRPEPGAPFNELYDWQLAQPRSKRPTEVVRCALMTGGGKFTLSYGAYLCALGITSRDRATYSAGAVVAAVGMGIFYAGAHAFASAIAQIKPEVARRAKWLSVTGASVLAAAFALQGYAAAPTGNHTVWFSSIANVAYWLGTSVMAFSFSFFVAASQAVFGDILPEPRRGVVAWGMLLPLLSSWRLVPARLPHHLGLDAGMQLCTATLSFFTLFAAGLAVSSARPWIFAPPERRALALYPVHACASALSAHSMEDVA